MQTPLFILAPMDDVTDTVFRRIVYDCAPFDVAMTEFVNVDGLCSPGRSKLLHRLSVQHDAGPVIAQIWGKRPENFYTIAKELASGEIPGFCGVDINFGCPEKSVVKNECCSALQKPELRDRALEIINAVKAGVADGTGITESSPCSFSIKTRLGFSETDYSWHEFLLLQQPDMLTVHARTTRQMSKVPAQWDAIDEIVKMRNSLSPQTKIILNGDISDHDHGQELIKQHTVDGVMIGRGVFHNPYCFAVDANAVWHALGQEERIALFERHLTLFEEAYPDGMRNFAPLKKFAKIYISDFPGAAELRERIMQTHSVSEARAVLAR